jgi:signal transduction histidine kinase
MKIGSSAKVAMETAPTPLENQTEPDMTGPTKHLFEIISHLQIATAVFDRSGVCTFCSPRMTEILTSSPRSIESLISGITDDTDIQHRLHTTIDDALLRGTIASIVCPCDIPGTPADEVTFEVISVGESHTKKFSVILREAKLPTDSRVDLERLGRLAALGKTAAGATHEFNNILTSVLGWTQVARQKSDPTSGVGSALEIIEDNARRAKEIASQILNISRADSDEDIPESTSMAKIIDDSLRLLSWEMTASDIDVILDFDEIPNCNVDPKRVGQVFINIIRNAMDVMPGGGTLTVTLAHKDNQIRASLHDTGPGMSPEVLDKVFDSFFTTKERRDKSTRGGSGLGLSISRGIMEKYDGTIEAESSPGNGTCFTVTVPATVDTSVTQKEERPSVPSVPPGAIVLVVDDERDIGDMVRTSLELKGTTVLVANNGEEAMALCRQTQFDAAFVDFAMPGISGHRLGRELLGIQPDMPLIFMSGLEIDADTPIADFLKKPFSLDDIQYKLRQVLQKD